MNGIYEKTAVVTAGARGIGAAVVRRLSGEGYAVVFSYRNSEKEAAELAAELKNVFCFRADLSSADGCGRLAEFALSRLGRVDALVCNAGSSYYGIMPHTSEETFDRMVGDNLKSAYLVCRAFYDSFVSAGKGSIVCISSVWGIRGASCETAYSAAKAGITGLVTSLAMELAPSGIRVNSVAPGITETAMTGRFTASEREAMLGDVPLGRFGRPEDAAAAVAFLAGDDSSYITGQVINVSGGFLL